MAQNKHLRELLKEDQEPFLLKNYMSERRSQLKRPSPNTTLQLRKKPQQQNSNFPINLCKNACFLSIHKHTTHITKSPLFEFASPTKSPLRSPNAIFLHIPSKTATLLLEAALRIQKHSNTKPRHDKTNKAFGLFGSFFKKLTNRKKHIEGCSNNDNNNEVVGSREVGFTCSCDGRPSSAVWSESNEDKSLDMETSCSGHSFDDSVEEKVKFVNKQKQNAHRASFDDHHHAFFSESPFRFVLQHSPSSSSSSGHRTPEFSSPPASPNLHRTQDKESNGDDGVNKFQSGEEEEDKEQCSPVSVLDPPFEDDDDGHENDHEEDDFDLECSYANVQRTKKQLLDRLRRFEKLTELDPIELETRMLDQEDKEYQTFFDRGDYGYVDSETSCEEKSSREIVFEILCHSSVQDIWQAPEDLKRLIYDLIMEEEREPNSSVERNMVITRVCRRLESWKEVESNTIDMMIEEDFSREEGRWKKNAEQTRQLAGELELAIFCFLVEELSEELVC